MKKLRKINFAFAILSIIIIVGFLFYGIILEKKVADRSYNRKEENLNHCVEHNLDDEECAYIIKYIGNKQKLTLDTVSFYMQVAISPKTHSFNLVLLILIILPALYNLCKLFKSRNIINIINRTDYKKLLRKILLGVYKFALILPISLGVIFLITFLITGHFDYSYAIVSDVYGLFWFNINGIIFILLFLVALFFFGIFFINLGLIVLRKNHNIIIIIIETFLLYIGLELTIEVCEIIPSFLGINHHFNFDIINILSAGYATNIYEMIIFPLVLAIITFGVVLLLYKDKEKLIIDCEKNN